MSPVARRLTAAPGTLKLLAAVRGAAVAPQVRKFRLRRGVWVTAVAELIALADFARCEESGTREALVAVRRADRLEDCQVRWPCDGRGVRGGGGGGAGGAPRLGSHEKLMHAAMLRMA